MYLPGVECPQGLAGYFGEAQTELTANAEICGGNGALIARFKHVGKWEILKVLSVVFYSCEMSQEGWRDRESRSFFAAHLNAGIDSPLSFASSNSEWE